MPITIVQGVVLQPTVQGDAAALAAVSRMEREIRSANGAFRRAVGRAAEHAQRYAREITHIDTGELQAAHRSKYTGRLRAEVFIDRGQANMRGGRPHIYGVYEHARGGDHAFYARTVNEEGIAILLEAANTIIASLP